MVYHIHGREFHLFYDNNKKVVTKTFQKCDAVIALSEYLREIFKKEEEHLNVCIIENVVSPPEINGYFGDYCATHFGGCCASCFGDHCATFHNVYLAIKNTNGRTTNRHYRS